jgi:1-acyl-sn-glycerol-3-phosphate acyltransferase
MSKKSIYPQRRLLRSVMRLVGRIFLPLLTKVEVEGLERFPRTGSLIVVGNHTGALEVVLLTLYAPRIIEYLGSVDIPHEGYIATFIYTYGFIPVFRGNASRAAMEAGLEVLRQDAVLGLFPEGGIWEPSIRRAQAGVAWLSYRGEAPILPIGFGSTRGALVDMLRLKRPKLTMRVGELIPAIAVTPGKPRKQQLQEAADRIVDGIWALVPEEEQAEPIPIADETFAFAVEVLDMNGMSVSPSPGNFIQ